MDQIKIGAFLKALRKEKNMTQEQLAEQLGVSNRTVSRWETGSNMPDISLLTEIAEFYDISKALADYGNDDFQAIVFDGIPEDQQPETHTKFADDLRVIRIETKNGLRFYIDVHPTYGWIFGNGTLSYYQINEQMSDWLSQNLK